MNQRGPVWMSESFDHIIRSPAQLERIRQYIEDNPKIERHRQDACDTIANRQDACDTIANFLRRGKNE
jgi:hypothetical protein